MATRRSTRLANKHQNSQQSIPEPPLTIAIDNSPSEEFRSEQDNQETDEIENALKSLFDSQQLDKHIICSKPRKILSHYHGDDLPIQSLMDSLPDTNMAHFITLILEEYPDKETIVRFGKLSLKVIYYIHKPDSVIEAAYIINSIRAAYKTLWMADVKNKIQIWKYRKQSLQRIVEKNGLSKVDENGHLLSVIELTELIHQNISINMNCLRVSPPNNTSSNSNSASLSHLSVNNGTQQTQTQNEPNPPHIQQEIQPMRQPTQEEIEQYLINDLKKNKEKYRKFLRVEMMDKIAELQNENTQLSELIDALEIALEESDFVEASVYKDNFEKIRVILNKIDDIRERQHNLYKAVPRRPSSRYVGRPELILDLNNRIKQYNNEMKQIIPRLFELANQTRSPIMIAAASGPCYGVNKSSTGTLWISPVMTLASMPHCLKIKEIWDHFLEKKFAPQRAELQENYKYLSLMNKVKGLVAVAEQHKCEIILKKIKEVELGYLLTRMEDENIELETEEIDLKEDKSDDDNDTEMSSR